MTEVVVDKIGSICLVGDGAHASIKRVPYGKQYLTSKNFTTEGLNLKGVDYISEEDFLKYFKEKSKALTKPKTGDILLSIIGSLGSAYLVKPNDEFGLSSSVSIIRANNNIVLPEYLLYWIKSDYFLKSLNAIKSGVAQSFLSLEMIRSLPVVYPVKINTQRKITSILSAYDDLIENNLMRIKLLEEIAQRTYEEWFVKFRINGKQLPIDKKTGLPEGWEKKKITECISFKQQKEKVKKFEGEIIYLATADVEGTQITGKGEIINWENKPSRAQIKLTKESVWFARMSNTYKVIVATNNFNNEYIISSGFAGFKPANSKCLPFLFCLINSQDFNGKKNLFATGSTQVSLNDISLSSIEIIEPKLELVEKFGEKFLKSLELRQNLFDQNQHLKTSRDILLPKLMSGKIDIQ